MARQNNTKFAILSLLNKTKLSGYGIRQRFEKKAQFYWSETNAQIYPILKQLEKDNLVSSKIDEASGKRNTRIYEITESGKLCLQEWVLSPVNTQNERNELLLKLESGYAVDKSVLLGHLNRFKNQLDDKLTILKEITKHLELEHSGRKDQKYLLLNYDYCYHIICAQQKWCLQTITALK